MLCSLYLESGYDWSAGVMVLMAEGGVEGLAPNSSKDSLCAAVDWVIIPQSTESFYVGQ